MTFSELFTTPGGLTIRFVFLRLHCLAALVILIADIVDIISIVRHVKTYGETLSVNAQFIIYYLTAPIIFVHHVLSAFGPSFSLPGILDLVLIIAELAGATSSFFHGQRIAYLSAGLVFCTIQVQFWMLNSWPQPDNYVVTTYPAIWICVLTLLALTFVRVTDVKRDGLKSLWGRYDYRALTAQDPSKGESDQIEVGSPKGVNDDLPDDAATSSRSRTFITAIGILTGRSLWQPHFPGETGSLITFRALIAVVIILGVTVAAFWKIIFQPIQQMWLVPISTSTSIEIPPNAMPKAEIGWDIFLSQVSLSSDGMPSTSQTSFIEAVSVKAIWPRSALVETCSFQDSPSRRSVTTNHYDATDDTSFSYVPRVLRFNCQQKISTDNKRKGLREEVEPYTTYIHPDFLISVNFTRANLPLELAATGTENIVHAYLGLSENSDVALQNTSPTTLVPGVNLVGMAEITVRQQLSANAWGLFKDTPTTFLLAEIVHLWADPRPINPDLMATGSDIATLRIRAQARTGDWRIVQDFRDKNVLDGFSNIGGLWAFLGGIFALLYGSSIMEITFGQKPLTLFGLAHSFQKNAIGRAIVNEYRQIQDDILGQNDRRGLLRMMCDHIIDVGFLLNTQSAPLHADEKAGQRDEPSDIEKGKVDQ